MDSNRENYTRPWLKMPKPFIYFKVINNSDNSPADFLLTAVNPAFEAMAGLAQKKLVNQSILSFVSSSNDGGFDWQMLYKALVEAEKPAHLFECYDGRNNRRYEISAWSDPPGYLAAVFFDLTARKKQEEDLRENDLRFQALVAAMETALVVEDSKRNIILVNQAFCDLFSIPVLPEKLIGTNCSNAAEQAKELLAVPELFPRRIEEIISKRKLVIGEEIHFATRGNRLPHFLLIS